jgi:hypothetical protein
MILDKGLPKVALNKCSTSSVEAATLSFAYVDGFRLRSPFALRIFKSLVKKIGQPPIPKFGGLLK